MKKLLVVPAVMIFLIIFAVTCYAEKAAKEKSGEELFKQHCAVCHQDKRVRKMTSLCST